MPHSVSPSNTNFTLYPLAWLTLFFAFGVWIGNILNFPWQIYLVICLISFILSLIFARKNFAVIFLFLAFTSVGGLYLQVAMTSISSTRLKSLFDSARLNSGEPIEVVGISLGNPELAIDGFFLILKTETVTSKGVEEKVSGNIRLFLPIRDEQIAAEYEQLDLGYGTRIRVGCELHREEQFQNPGGISTKEILDRQGIDAVAVVKSPLLLQNLGKTPIFLPAQWIAERRQNLILEFKKHFSVSTAGVLIASILGNKYHLDKTTSESFREGGTFHILVISGLQITFIGGLAILLLRQFTKNRFWQFLLAAAFLWAYTIAVGAAAPVTRAALMFTVLYFAFAIFREATLLNTLAASALVLLLWQPSELFDPSFQLTFMCVLAIVSMSVKLLGKLKAIGIWHPTVDTPIPPNATKWLKTLAETIYWSEKNWQQTLTRSVWHCVLFKTPYAEKLEGLKLQVLVRHAFETIVVSAVVQAWLLPFAVVYFHRISLVSIFLNVWVGALMAIESATAVIGILTTQISEDLAAPLIWATEILNWLILNVTILVIDNNWSSIRIPHYAGKLKIVYLIYFLTIVALTRMLYKWQPFELKSEVQPLRSKIQTAFASFFFLFGMIIFHPFSAPNPDGNLQLDFLDVGQGDSALLTMPTGETMLIDGGGKANFNKLYVIREGEEAELFEPDVQNIGETVVSKFLWEKGYDRIDYLLATHADTDHIQGLTDVARNFSINSAIVARTPLQDEDFAEFHDVLHKKHIPLVKVKRGDLLNFGEVQIEVLSPNSDENRDSVSENNQSIVLRVAYRETTILLTGDIEKETEKELLLMPELLHANIVKVAHHGSRTSSIQGFVQAVKAKLAVLSVGRTSPFGHPHEEVVKRWKNSGAKILTTGENGTISISSNGKLISIKTLVR